PLALMYSNVSYDLARDKADTAAFHRADSLVRVVHSAAQARAAARRMGLDPLSHTLAIGTVTGFPNEDAWTRSLERTPPGQLVPGVRSERVGGAGIAWVDSITAPERPTWENARAAVLQRYELEGGQRALAAKRAELDSMMAAGWTLDSLATLWG